MLKELYVISKWRRNHKARTTVQMGHRRKNSADRGTRGIPRKNSSLCTRPRTAATRD